MTKLLNDNLSTNQPVTIPKQIEEVNDITPDNNVTEIVFILDKSGSMSGLEDDTIGGFNALLKKHKTEKGVAYVSTILFSNFSTVLHDRLNVLDVTPLTKKDYIVGGCTALLDAIGDAINHIKNIHKYARREDVPSSTIFIITTDGLENASRKYSSSEVKNLIETQKREYGWEFLFLADNIDAIETAKNDTAKMFDTVSDALYEVRHERKLSRNWSSKLKDYVE